MDKDFFNRRAELVARDLLRKILNVNDKRGKIVETEAYYGEEDPASRARQNGDLRATMLMGGGTVLVYGVHNSWLVNFVTGKKGKAEAVLLRAIEPLNFQADCKGPGKLAKALGIDKSFHKTKVGEGIKIEKNNEKFDVANSKRVGVQKDLDKNLRFYIKDNKFVSR